MNQESKIHTNVGLLSFNIIGGLGNQLFQIFFTISLAKKYKMRYVFPKKDLLLTGRKQDSARHAYYNLLPSLTLSSDIPNAIHVNEHGFRYSDIVIDPAQNYVFNGFYQSYKYLDSTIDPAKYFKLPDTDQALVERVMVKLRRDNRPLVSIHIRRGDALSKLEFHNVVGVQYVHNALTILQNKGIVNPKFVVFSDGLEWCKENLRFLGDCEFMEQKDYVEFVIMSRCDHQVVANSTYSWWAAYMNRNSNKTIIYPSKWFEMNVDTSDLCPPSWIKCQI